MIQANLHDAKTNLSEYIERLQKGERVVLCKRNTPIAEIIAIPERQTTPRPIGLAKEILTVPDSFFEDLPEGELALFEGELP